MQGKSNPKPSRVGWIVVHGGLLGCGLWLLMLAEDHGERSPSAPTFLEQSPGKSSEPDRSETANPQTEIKKQIARLRDPISGVRAKAMRQLMAFGCPAIPSLAEALSHPDPNVRRHAQLILARLIRRDDECFSELESVACSPEHPASKEAAGILQRECSRRVDVETAMIEHRKANARRYLRKAQEALSRGQFLKARQMVFAADALHVTYQPVENTPALILQAIDTAEQQASILPRPTLVTAERE